MTYFLFETHQFESGKNVKILETDIQLMTNLIMAKVAKRNISFFIRKRKEIKT